MFDRTDLMGRIATNACFVVSGGAFLSYVYYLIRTARCKRWSINEVYPYFSRFTAILDERNLSPQGHRYPRRAFLSFFTFLGLGGIGLILRAWL
jgi:hypothetical protein